MNKSNPSRARQPKPLKVLFADDEVPLQELIADELPRMGYSVTVCPDGLTAVAAIEKFPFDCLIVDLDMPGLNGIQVIERAKQISPHIEAIVLTGKSSKDSAIAALRLGAFDYLQKPCTLIELQTRLQRVADKLEMAKRLIALELRLKKAEGLQQMVGSHALIEQVRRLVQKVAPTDSTVLVTGETGTGKELIARAIHEQSPRSDKPFLAINCGALPENLIESELFGHRRGAFTGAEENRQGVFEVADGGTLFLDEVGELPKSVQTKLLRVLETGEVRRVGDNMPFKVDVRIVAATHRVLKRMVARDDFRELLAPLAAGELVRTVTNADVSALSAFAQNYLTATVEYRCVKRGAAIPHWAHAVDPLPAPWFATELRSLRVHLLRTSPVAFRRRNLFIDSGPDARV